jgi:cell wall-associated NlpC family hydrolase
MRTILFSLFLSAGLLPSTALAEGKLPPQAPTALPAHGIPGVSEEMLEPGFWIARLQGADEVVLDAAAIAAQNTKLMAIDPSMHRLEELGPELEAAQVRAWIERLSKLPSDPLYDVEGNDVSAEAREGLHAALALEAIPARQPTRFGLVVRRASLRAFPTNLRVFDDKGDTDIDRFQESALFVGMPVLIAHRSADGGWLFVVSRNYAAWIEADAVAEGDRAEVLGHAAATPFRVVTGARVQTVNTREEPRVSELVLDMGTRLPLAEVPADEPVNGQHPYTAWPLRLPVRAANGGLQFVPALLQRNTDSHAGPLPYTRANLIRQAFKFLGERYGWGHSYDGRDCSGFVSEIYRSVGVELPRNTSDQGKSPALQHIDFDKGEGPARRRAEVDSLQVGDLIYIPGHVMMMIGRIDGQPYVIHDTNGGSFLDADGQVRSRHLNAVSVTPLLPLRFSRDSSYVDRMTHIVRIRP